MTDRFLDIAESPAYLHVRDGLLCIRPNRDDKTEATVPLKELHAHRPVRARAGRRGRRRL